MADTDNKMAPLLVSRWFAAPRMVVFQAWSTAEHIKRWFCPEGMTVPSAEAECRAGGAFTVCMRAPDGQEFWSRGVFAEVAPPARLVFHSTVEIGGVARFSARTVVDFSEAEGGARMAVRQDFDIHDPAVGGAVDGASEGWRSMLDRLEREVARIRDGGGA